MYGVPQGVAVIGIVAAFVAKDMHTPLHGPAFPSTSSVLFRRLSFLSRSLSWKGSPPHKHRAGRMPLILPKSLTWPFWAEDYGLSDAF